MANLVAIDNKNHKDLRIDPSKAEQHGAELNLVPVVLNEFTHLVVQYPIVLTKNSDTGQFVCAAMLGFELGENLFWQQQQWQGLYVPLQIRRQPFFVGAKPQQANDDSPNDYVVCINSESPCIVDKNHEPTGSYKSLFNDDGSDSDYFQQMQECLSQLLQGEAINKDFITQLEQLALIQPLSLEIAFANQDKSRLNGLYTIDQQKLTALSGEQLVHLHQAGYLSAIYTMVASLGQIYALIDRKNKQC